MNGLTRFKYATWKDIACPSVFRAGLNESAGHLSFTSKGTVNSEWSPLMVVAVMVILYVPGGD